MPSQLTTQHQSIQVANNNEGEQSNQLQEDSCDCKLSTRGILLGISATGLGFAAKGLSDTLNTTPEPTQALSGLIQPIAYQMEIILYAVATGVTGLFSALFLALFIKKLINNCRSANNFFRQVDHPSHAASGQASDLDSPSDYTRLQIQAGVR